MTGDRATCSSGTWLAVAGSDCWALLELARDDPRADAALTAVESREPIDELLDVMISHGLRRLPGFAILGRHEGRLRYVVRPPAQVGVVTTLGTERIEEVTAGSWRDGLLDGVPEQVSLSSPTAGAGEVPLSRGGSAAGRIIVTLAPQVADPKPEQPQAEDPVLGHTVARDPLSARLEATPQGPQQPPPGPPSGPPGIIDGVPWDVSFPGSLPAAPPPPRPSRWAPPPAAPPPTPPPPPRPPLRPDQLPPPTPQSAVAGAPPRTGPTGTRKRSDLLRELARTPPRPSGPTVWAVVCPAGHLTPSYAATCRVCATPLPEDQTPVEVARPPLGRLVLSSGGAVTLDRDAVFGRAPTSSATDPSERPNLVKLSDSGQISRRHAEVRIEGWVAVVRDLGSANGTTLTLPGGVVQQLRAQEDYPLEPGSVVTLADVVSFTYEIPMTGP